MRMVGSTRNRGARTGVLHVDIRFSSEQECGGAAGNTTASHKDRKENVLRCGVRLPYPAALRSARRDSDYR